MCERESDCGHMPCPLPTPVVSQPRRLYRLAVEEGFTRGRVVAQVAACCLYIICRQEAKPFMMIDLSDLLQVKRLRGGVLGFAGVWVVVMVC